MSVLIKGMDKSKSCNGCIMCVDGKYGERCLLTNQYIEPIIDNCYLVALPEKHGRLIDADALAESIKTYPSLTTEEMNIFLKILAEEVTVIETEG